MSRKALLAAILVLGGLASLVTSPTEAAPPPCGEAYCCAPGSTPQTKCNNNGHPDTCATWFLRHVCP
jgi:hypothetical protein